MKQFKNRKFSTGWSFLLAFCFSVCSKAGFVTQRITIEPKERPFEELLIFLLKTAGVMTATAFAALAVVSLLQAIPYNTRRNPSFILHVIEGRSKKILFWSIMLFLAFGAGIWTQK